MLKKLDIKHLPLSKNALFIICLNPVVRYFYEPYIDYRDLSGKRNLPYLDLNIQEQLSWLDNLKFGDEIKKIDRGRTPLCGLFRNNTFRSGDAEYLYQMIRHLKPKRIVEVGGGYSSLIINEAIKKNLLEENKCEHICIDPYAYTWLQKHGIKVIKKNAEHVDINTFEELEINDILFIDSTHVIIPEKDVLSIYFEIIPRLKKGVIVHIHDIFTPLDYPLRWRKDKMLLWNEQYLVEMMLHNKRYKILGLLNHLFHNHTEKYLSVCPVLQKTMASEPCSCWFRID